MPTAVLRCEQCGKVFTREYSARDLPENLRLGAANPCENGDCPGQAYRDLHLEQSKTSSVPGNWPILSVSMGVLAEQKAEAEKELRDAGVPTEFVVRDGAALPKLTSPEHKYRVSKALGYHDKDGNRSH